MRSKPKLQNINDKPDNQVMHFDGFGKAYGFSAQPFYTGSQGEILALNGLRAYFTHAVILRLNITLITAPIIRVEHGYTERFQQGFQLSKYNIFSLPKRKRHYLSVL